MWSCHPQHSKMHSSPQECKMHYLANKIAKRLHIPAKWWYVCGWQGRKGSAIVSGFGCNLNSNNGEIMFLFLSSWKSLSFPSFHVSNCTGITCFSSFNGHDETGMLESHEADVTRMNLWNSFCCFSSVWHFYVVFLHFRLLLHVGSSSCVLIIEKKWKTGLQYWRLYRIVNILR